MDNSGDLGAWEATTFDLSSACFFLDWGRPREDPGAGGPSEKGIRGGM